MVSGLLQHGAHLLLRGKVPDCKAGRAEPKPACVLSQPKALFPLAFSGCGKQVWFSFMPNHTAGLLGDPHLGGKKDGWLGLVITKRAFKCPQL